MGAPANVFDSLPSQGLPQSSQAPTPSAPGSTTPAAPANGAKPSGNVFDSLPSTPGGSQAPPPAVNTSASGGGNLGADFSSAWGDIPSGRPLGALQKLGSAAGQAAHDTAYGSTSFLNGEQGIVTGFTALGK